MRVLSTAMRAMPDFKDITALIDMGKPSGVTGLAPVHRALMSAALHVETERPVFVICADEAEAGRFASDIASLTGEEPLLLSGRDFVFRQTEAASREWQQKRLAVLYRMARKSAPIVVATPDAVLQRTLPPQKLLSASFTLNLGDDYDLTQLTSRLTAAGYSRCDQVEGQGQFSLRGGILDFFSPSSDYPVRAEFFGDTLDSMGIFDPATQRRIENIKTAGMLPAAEVLPGMHDGSFLGLSRELSAFASRVEKRKTANPKLVQTLRQDAERIGQNLNFPAADRYAALIYPEFSTALDYISDDSIVIICEHSSTAERASSWLWQLGEDIESLLVSGELAGEFSDLACTWETALGNMARHPVVYLDSFTSAYPDELAPKGLFDASPKQLSSYGGSLETAVADIAHYTGSEYSVAVLCSSEHRARALSQALFERGISAIMDRELDKLPPKGRVSIAVGALSSGFVLQEIKLAVITEDQLIVSPSRRPRRKKTSREHIQSFTDLAPGDLVVHVHHGIGRFVKMEKITLDGIERDYIKIAYRGTDCLYVPATSLDLISKYIGSADDSPVKLNKLGGDAWAKSKSRAKKAAKDLARSLIDLYARRLRTPGYAFSPDSEWQKEFDESFEYSETDDQLRCIEEIKRDMESPHPMDRLLCGDVGFGKTEVAMRAIMKCILDGKQAAILVPTTVLAQQHFITSAKRFSRYPVHIELLSRFRSQAQIKASIRRIANGTADLVIGTHRLLQKDVLFKDLGLLIVDEEQRFGVAHKERLKELSATVDVLTLTATPIPRTLNMALSGIRDMSTIEEPPSDRQPVQTYVLEYSPAVVAEAIRRETGRGGQVYYLHNRVESIDRTASRLARQFPDLVIDVAHGQMPEEDLSNVMQRMFEGEIQVLVCTTIIETGLDIPNVNTLIIEDADHLGLAQLHQLRGRVGRSSRRAFTYLTYRPGKALSDVATKRLAAIREYTEFGSGFKIAMRDLELRGAGNVLGAEQSGNLMSVGYDMYLQLLEEAVLEEQGKLPRPRSDCTADLLVSASIPDSYITSAEQRIDFYRRIAAIRDEQDRDDIIDEMVDRYGDPPANVLTLLSVALMRSIAASCMISEISQKDNALMLKLAQHDFRAVSALCSEPSYKGRIRFSAGDAACITLRLSPGESVVKAADKLVRQYSAALAALKEEQ